MTITEYEKISDGYYAIMGEVRAAWDGGDIWGSVMSNLFGLATVAYVEFDEILPEFSPGAGIMTADEDDTLEDYPDSMYQDMVRNGIVSLADIELAYRVLSRYADLIPEDRRY